MKNRSLAGATLLALSVCCVNTVIAETCYNVEGAVQTINVSSNVQVGDVDLILSDAAGVVVLAESGSISGNITGNDGFGTIYLSHTVRLAQGDSFVTSNDRAQLVYPFVRNVEADGTACSYWIHETIDNIVNGTRFFRNVSSAEIFADGYISNCSTENENYFDLSGRICLQ